MVKTMRKLLLDHLNDLKDFKLFKNYLRDDVPKGLEPTRVPQSLDRSDTVDLLIEKYGSDNSLIVTIHVLIQMDENNLVQELQENSKNVCKSEASWEEPQRKHKAELENKYEKIYEGIATDQVRLKDIYTELVIIEGKSEGVTVEHEVVLLEQASVAAECKGTVIARNKIFSPLDQKIKTVLTTGIAGIGKTVMVQQFVLDWVEGTANKDIHFIFVLPFRELDLIKDDKSMLQLLGIFHPYVADIEEFKYLKLLFIFDGLDECKLPLNFASNNVLNELNKASSVDVLLTNLIKGHLFHDAHIWITTRHATAHKIPHRLVSRFTDIRGFNNSQKEEYFKKADPELATNIIAHIKSCPSLHIMCHLPIFCRISVNVLKTMMREENSGAEIPRTLTEMYIHFLLIQTSVKNEKYHGEIRAAKRLSDDDKALLFKLGELAFKQLESDEILFREDDMRACGIAVDVAQRSGMCTEIIKVESGLYNEKMYCFVHLSIQELFAALYVFCEFVKTNRNLLTTQKNIREVYQLPPHLPMTLGKKEEIDDEDYIYFSSAPVREYETVTVKFQKIKGTNYCTQVSCNVFTPLSGLLKIAVDKSLASERGLLDLFVRFLVGISQKSNQTLLQSLLTPVEGNPGSLGETDKCISETIEFINRKIREDPQLGSAKKESHNPERLNNMVHCLTELGDNTLPGQVLASLNSARRDRELTAPQCSALAYILTGSDHPSDIFDLKSYNANRQTGYSRMIPLIKRYKTVRLDHSRIGLEVFEAVVSALKGANSIQELDLSNNVLPSEMVGLLCQGLKHNSCMLQTLRLERCSLTGEACEALAAALSFKQTRLEYLSVSGNDLLDSGVKVLLSGLVSPQSKLQILSLESCGLTGNISEEVAAALCSAGSQLKELDLSSNHLGDSGVQRLCQKLGGASCAIQTIRLGECNLTQSCCGDLALALRSSLSDLICLDLMHNELRDRGVELLAAALADPQCKLQKLWLSGCDVTEDGCDFVVRALVLNPVHLRELDLGHDTTDDPGYHLFTPLLKEPSCRLEKLEVSQKGEWRRATLLKYACSPLTFDETSMSTALSLSENLRSVSCGAGGGPSVQHSGCFAYPQVMCREGLTGRCYWEVEWKGQGCYIGLTHQGIPRAGVTEECVFGVAKGSWALFCSETDYQLFSQGEASERKPVVGSSQRVGVFLDGEEDHISFYAIAKDTARPLHSVSVSVTEPLFPGFYLGPNTTISLCQPLR